MESSSSFSYERGPRLLKDFLFDESSSSNDFMLNPKKTRLFRSNHSKLDENYSSLPRLIRSRSKAASSAVHKASDIVMNAMKFFPILASKSHNIKSPSILPRSISRKLLRKTSSSNQSDQENQVVVGDVKVKIKDILRWKSFRDLAMEEGDASFQLEENVAAGYIEKITTKPKWQQLQFDENDQHSPVSVLDSPFREDGQSFPIFHPNLADVERKKFMLMQRVEEFESLAMLEPVSNLGKEFSIHDEENSILELEGEAKNYDALVEEKAKEILMHLMENTSFSFEGKSLEAIDECLLLDFFRQELATSTKNSDDHEEYFDGKILRLAEAWINKECNIESSSDWELLEEREASIRDMEKGIRWNTFEEQELDIGCELEVAILYDLFDELLVDLIVK